MLSFMMRLGCLAVVLVVGAAGYVMRDVWLPSVRARVTTTKPDTATTSWEPLTTAAAARGRDAFARLAAPDGPVFVNLTAAEFSSAVLDSVLPGLSAAASGAEVLARDDQLLLRGHVSVSDLGGSKFLGPLAGMVEGRQQISLHGRVEVLGRGRAQYRVTEIGLQDLKLPAALIPRLVARVARARRDTSIAPNAVPLRVPPALADLRVARGRVTLYKSVP